MSSVPLWASLFQSPCLVPMLSRLSGCLICFSLAPRNLSLSPLQQHINMLKHFPVLSSLPCQIPLEFSVLAGSTRSPVPLSSTRCSVTTVPTSKMPRSPAFSCLLGCSLFSICVLRIGPQTQILRSLPFPLHNVRGISGTFRVRTPRPKEEERSKITLCDSNRGRVVFNLSRLCARHCIGDTDQNRWYPSPSNFCNLHSPSLVPHSILPHWAPACLASGLSLKRPFTCNVFPNYSYDQLGSCHPVCLTAPSTYSHAFLTMPCNCLLVYSFPLGSPCLTVVRSFLCLSCKEQSKPCHQEPHRLLYFGQWMISSSRAAGLCPQAPSYP